MFRDQLERRFVTKNSPDIIIVNFRSAPLIGRTVASAREFAGEEARMILVDNSPGDGAAEIVRSGAPDATVIANAVNRGYAAAVNQALAVADADFVLLINPDVRYVSGSYADVLDAFRHSRVGAVVTRLLNTDGTLQPNCIRAPRPFDLISEDVALAERFPNWQRPRRYRMMDWDQDDARQVDAATGACLFIRRAAIADVGLFDERFFVYYEETDWLIRAKRRGWRTVFLPTVEAVHASAGSSPGVRSRHALLLLESQHRYARKHFGKMTTTLLRATLLGIDTARLVRHALTGRADARAAAVDRIRVHLTMRAPRPS
jgi:N-acetylglucosaminyl-diphospho-decaprenol L-rhamnosyltransferase